MLKAMQLTAHLRIQSGDCIKVKGTVNPDAETFSFNLGQDETDLILHFNPRFEFGGDTRTVVCNSKTCGEWGEEHRESEFPFQQGEDFKIFISFDTKEVTVKMPKDQEFKFPNRMELESAGYFSVNGDLKIKSIKFH